MRTPLKPERDGHEDNRDERLLVALCGGRAGGGASCKDTAAEKKLAGAALTSFTTKCQKDEQASCDKQAQEKKLNGAAKTSFTKKCVKDATGAS